MEARTPVMKSSNGTARRPSRAIASGLASIAGALLLLTCFSFQSRLLGTTALADRSSLADAGYVGSAVCSKCHPSIYESFLRTAMGRSMLEVRPAPLERIPTSANILHTKINRYFETYARDRNVCQSEYEITADGKDAFRETRKFERIIGLGAKANGATMKQGDYLSA